MHLRCQNLRFAISSCKINVKRKLRLQIFKSSSRKFLHFQVTANIVRNYEIRLMLFYDVKVEHDVTGTSRVILVGKPGKETEINIRKMISVQISF